ncbi:MAG: isocitrate lyase/PEP mutase family protein [Thermodesulfobacteriota bacterium]
MVKAQELREILSRPYSLVVPGVYDCLSAKISEKTGFEVIFTSGFGISASTLGLPDFGFLGESEMIGRVNQISKSVNIPVVADIDTGYGNQINVIKTVSDIVDIGVAGVILEDQMWPKKCGHFEGKQIISMEEHVEKIHATIYARRESGLVIFARTDARAPLGLDEAIRRGRSYLDAGADVLFIEAPESVEELREISSAFPDDWLLANMVEGGKTPLLSAEELEELGYKFIVFPVSALFAAAEAMEKCLSHIKKCKSTAGYYDEFSLKNFENIVDVSKFRILEKRFGVKNRGSK